MLEFVSRKHCPSCRSNNFTRVLKLEYCSDEVKKFLSDYYGEYFNNTALKAFFELVHCDSCNLIFQRQVLTKNSLHHFYESIIDSRSSLAKREEANANMFARLIRDASIVIKLARSIKPRDVNVLDFGMGWGHWAIAARSVGLSVHGAELSDSRISFAMKMGLPVVSLGDCASGFYDFINTDQVFEHLDEPLEILQSLADCLKDDGIIKIFVPNRSIDLLKMKLNIWKVGKDAFHPLEHINSFDRTSLDNLARSCGLVPLKYSEILRLGTFGCERAFKRALTKAPSWYYRKASIKC